MAPTVALLELLSLAMHPDSEAMLWFGRILTHRLVTCAVTYRGPKRAWEGHAAWTCLVDSLRIRNTVVLSVAGGMPLEGVGGREALSDGGQQHPR